MATQPKKELTEAEQYAAEEAKRAEELAAKEASEQEAAAEAAKAAEEEAAKAKADTGKAKTATRNSGARARTTAKPKERIEVYDQRGPKGLFRVTRNIDTGKTEAELIEPTEK